VSVRYELLPIRADDGTIAAAVAKASTPTLMMSLVHLTADVSLLRGPDRPAVAIPGQHQGGLSDSAQAEIRRRAVEALARHRDAGCPALPLPSRSTILEMMAWQVGEPVPAAYVPMMLEEMALDGADVRAAASADLGIAAARRDFSVLVIGAGMSGLLAAIRLEEAGIPYTVVEKNAAVGGTWLENSYPGCRVDIANHFYSYTFEPNHDWSEHFARQPELFEYFDRCADRYGVRKRIRFETEVVAARFDEPSARWDVELRTPRGTERLRADAIVSAVGQLNRPRIPDVPGRERFRGPSFHSGAWRHDVDLRGKRVAVIGTGASAFQLVPAIAPDVGRVFVFQRSPAWMVPNAIYHARVGEGTKWLLKHVPFYARWFRFYLFWPGSDALWPQLRVDPSWPHPERSVSAANDVHRDLFTQYIASQVRDPALLEKVVPRYPPFGKRMLQDNGSWLAALQRENVELVTEGIREIDEDAIVTADGERRPVDAIVWATGFHANRFLWPMRIVGRGGAELAQVWGEEPRAYLGITVPRFPNLFCLYGPGTNLAHAGSIIFHSECQVRYVMGCLAALLERGAAALDCKQQAFDEYVARFDAQMAEMVWSHPGMTSWYKNAAGKVTTTSPWRLVDYWRWTREPELADYELLTPAR
jgi:4-hydroxyacetophenone monooxygenase